MQTKYTPEFPELQIQEMVITTHLLMKTNLSSDDGRQLALAYRLVFAQHPWYEQLRCKDCEQQGCEDRQFPFYEADSDIPKCVRPIPENGKCDLCNSLLEEFWPEERVLGDFRKEFDEYDLTVIYAKQKTTNQIIGFATGFVTTPIGLEKNLKLPSFAQRLPPDCLVAYLSELGVVKEFRQNGIARHLRDIRQYLLAQHKPDYIIFRTRPNSVTFKWYTKENGFRIIDAYDRIDPHDPRVVLMLDNPAKLITFKTKE